MDIFNPEKDVHANELHLFFSENSFLALEEKGLLWKIGHHGVKIVLILEGGFYTDHKITFQVF